MRNSKFLGQTLSDFNKFSFHHYPISKIIKDAIIGVVVLLGLIFLARHLGDYITPAEEWIKSQGAYGPVIFIIAFWIGTIVFIPGNLYAIASGLLFGLVSGFIYISIAEVTGAIILFLIARYVARKTVERYLSKHPKFFEIDKIVSKKGIKMMILLRLVPLPYTFLCYLLGVSEVTFKDYVIALVVIFPKLFLMVYYGYVAKNLTKLSTGTGGDHSDLHYISLVVGVVVSIIAIAYIGHIVLLSLKRAEAK